MTERCDFCSDEEYEYAVQLEIEAYREQLAYDEEFVKYCEEEYLKEQTLLNEEVIIMNKMKEFGIYIGEKKAIIITGFFCNSVESCHGIWIDLNEFSNISNSDINDYINILLQSNQLDPSFVKTAPLSYIKNCGYLGQVAPSLQFSLKNFVEETIDNGWGFLK